MSALLAVRDAVDAALAEGVLPVVLLDLDSTLVRSGERHRRILVEFAEDLGRADVRAVAEAARPSDFHWAITEPLQAAGLLDEELRGRLLPYWRERFFSDAYGALDVPFPGAVQAVHALLDHGAFGVYLTARGAGAMAVGTVSLLRRWGFPLFDGRTMLVMKPDGERDGAYKAAALGPIARVGRVVAAFDNEPGHVNTFAAAFPEAVCVLVGTACSPDAPPLDARALRMPSWAPW